MYTHIYPNASQVIIRVRFLENEELAGEYRVVVTD